MELRCPSRIHGKVVDGRLEVKCPSGHCRKGGTVTFHYFDLTTGELLETRKFQDPKRLFESTTRKEVSQDVN